jgi:FAD:protein FMN transferase
MRDKSIVFVILASLFSFGTICCLDSSNKVALPVVKDQAYIHNKGLAQGTSYSAIYLQPLGLDLKAKIDERLRAFDMSLSTYKPQSIISRINCNDSTVLTDQDFEVMFSAAQETAEQTNGALDITVGPLVKAWGFAFGNKDHSKLPNPDDYLPFVGYKKVRIVNHKLIKDDPRILIDANAVAQGYSSDLIAELLEDNGCKNYMIEIGGEVVCKGMNPKAAKWRIGIDKPIDDSIASSGQLQAVVALNNGALTTAGNYRKFYYLNGKKYSHTIDPHTGRPVDHNLLSATVIAPTALMADAYDTAFMVLGVEKSLEICKKIHGLECYLIYVDKNGKIQVAYSKGFKKFLEL